MKRVAILFACAATASFFPAASVAQWGSGQQQCSQVAAYNNPNYNRCQAVGTTPMGKTIWLCC
jgi:hypothetical protein